MIYGYKIFTFNLTPPQKPAKFINFDDAALGSGGARALLQATCTQLAGGESDERKYQYTRFDRVTASGWRVLLLVSGGPFGEPAGVVDRITHAARVDLASDDVVLREGRVVFVVPPDGKQGLIVSEARGRSHVTPIVVKRLNTRLKSIGCVLRLDSDVADDVAWNGFLRADDVSVRSVELVQHPRASGAGRLTSEDNLRRARLVLDLDQEVRTQDRIVQAISGGRLRAGGKINLAGLVGLRRYVDDDFDEERLVVVKDRHERTLNVTHGWPSFVYEMGDERPDLPTFLAEIRAPIEDTLDSLGIERPGGAWWPTGDVTP